MTDETRKKIELLTNISIIAVMILLGAVLVKRNFLSAGVTARVQNPVHVGAKVALPGVDWAKNEQTLLLALNKGCHYCAESAPFYQRLRRELLGRANIKMIAVLPQPVEEAQRYLNEMDVTVSDVKQASPDVIGVEGTPTLILVDNAGTATGVWVGQLSAEQEAEVMGRVNGGNDVHTINAADLQRAISERRPVVVLDVRDREDFAHGHIPQAKNIPTDELDARAPNEMSSSDMIVTYCRCEGDMLSKIARETLSDLGFTNVVVLQGGIGSWEHGGLPVVSQQAAARAVN